MHELSIAEALIEQVRERMLKESGSRLCRVLISVGKLSGVDSDALSSAWELLVDGTDLQKAALEIRKMPVRIHCRACGKKTIAPRMSLDCRKCGSTDTEITSGRELLLRAMEIEKPD